MIAPTEGTQAPGSRVDNQAQMAPGRVGGRAPAPPQQMALGGGGEEPRVLFHFQRVRPGNGTANGPVVPIGGTGGVKRGKRRDLDFVSQV